MATDQLDVAPEAFLDALAWPAPATAPAAEAAPVAGAASVPTATEPDPVAAAGPPHHHRRTTWTLATAGLVVVAAGVLVGHALTTGPDGVATVAALTASQHPTDVLADDDVARLVVRPESTRLLVTTDQGAHYVARSASGELCLVRVPAGDLPSEVCVPDRVGADATIGEQGEGQVRLVADGATAPAADDGWHPAGPNVWVRG